MKQRSLLRSIPLFALAVACSLALVGCGGGNYGYTGGTAATVNGQAIEEDTVTKYIQDFRTSAEMTDKDSWGKWLVSNQLDAATIREQVIDYYVDIELTNQACEEKGITVEDSEIDAQVEQMKANYGGDEKAWNDALAENGITEEQYRESIKNSMLTEKLSAAVAEEEGTEASDDDVLSYLEMYSSMFDGSRKSSHILFAADDEETAQKVLDQINSGELDFAEAAKQYSTDTASAENGGDVGWDAINSFVTDYGDALNDLDKGEVSGLVTSEYGIHIIMCTDTFDASKERSDVSDYPEEFVDYIRGIVDSQVQSGAFDTWFNEYKEAAEIVINDMPENVPYNVDLSQVNTEDVETADDGTPTDDGTTEDAEQSAEESGE